MFYEVDGAGDVPRIVDVFRDGSGMAQCVGDYIGRENDLPGVDSLVEGSFLEATREMRAVMSPGGIEDCGERITLVQTDAEMFEEVWLRHRKR
ncbi:hypothetical protein CSW64_00370 [Caulobacter mirabilis]|uniref:Uncharacterized protein n=2 Tax=Caulobacter mirabilis TaxID=69666 RepID=A0A2D2ASI0_9CAUL|nr:hypothetical protein [Caulobacter mirabilis]ATQ40968.1 hypothetical protein CSW64_00370 [Caulobacter mirabilis]